MPMNRQFDAVLFDMDETLVHSAGLWRASDEALWAALGADYDEDVARLYAGSRCDRAVEIVMAHTPAATRPQQLCTVAACADFLRQGVLNALRSGSADVSAMPGAHEAVNRAMELGYRTAVVSGSPRPLIDELLKKTEITGFDLVMSTEEVLRGKPEPDALLEAITRLGLLAGARVLVVEDSLEGVMAARAAGMTCWAVPSSDNPEIARTATRSFASLHEVAKAL